MPESLLTRNAKNHLAARGWRVIKIHGGGSQEAGLPDLWCMRAVITLLMETKFQKNKTRKIQRNVMCEFLSQGAVVCAPRTMDEVRSIVEFLDKITLNLSSEVVKMYTAECPFCNDVVKFGRIGYKEIEEHLNCNHCNYAKVIYNNRFVFA